MGSDSAGLANDPETDADRVRSGSPPTATPDAKPKLGQLIRSAFDTLSFGGKLAISILGGLGAFAAGWISLSDVFKSQLSPPAITAAMLECTPDHVVVTYRNTGRSPAKINTASVTIAQREVSPYSKTYTLKQETLAQDATVKIDDPITVAYIKRDETPLYGRMFAELGTRKLCEVTFNAGYDFGGKPISVSPAKCWC